MRYPNETDVESYDETREHTQDAWSAIDGALTQCLTEEVTDITLEFRKMLYGMKEELEAAHSDYTLDRLAAAIVLQYTKLTHLSVNIGTHWLKCHYYDEEDDDDHTTDAQWRVIGNIIKLIQKVVGGERTDNP